MKDGQGRGKPTIVHGSGAVFTLAVMALVTMRANAMSPAVMADGGPFHGPTILVSYSDDIHAQQDIFNKGLPLKVDRYTTLQRVDYKKGHWNFHFAVGYYITRVKEFEDKKHASTIGALCMDRSFVQSLKNFGPFLYQYLDPSGQTADVVIPRDDCGE